MLTFLLLQIVSSMPIYGNFSQYYYYVELQDKKWILDQNFDAAIEFASDSKLKEIYQESQIDRGICNPIKLDNYTVQAQRFIFIQTLFLDKNIKNQTKDDKQQINEDQQTQNNENQQTQDDKQQQINENQQTQDNENQQINENQQTQDDKQQINENQLQIGNFTIKKTWARNYSQLQEINNYLGLSKIVKNSSSDLKLKLCLAQNGGYMKIGNFPKGDEYIQIKQNCIQNLQCLINLQWIEIKYSTMMGLNLIKAEIDLSSSYVYFPPNIYSEVMQKLYCQGYFCPKRNDKNGLVCYDNNDDNLETFYDRFEKIKFKFEGENSFIWFPQDYLVTNDDKTFCFPIKRETSQIILEIKNLFLEINHQQSIIKIVLQKQALMKQRKIYFKQNKINQKDYPQEQQYLFLHQLQLTFFLRKSQGIQINN
ncbi:unnamed protein product [Paramecium sonneborni]|uniref:Xylanase inhibitor C-terminal domain-containing protein n=1 Tax=Paramecium sonneborni TaxID=65129 RepID=A0A8S1KAG1_9CILI|nr:unnamed protein product [Paramecium sonneborni]